MSIIRRTDTGVCYHLPKPGELCSTDMTRSVYTWSCGEIGVGNIDCFSKEDFLKVLECLNKRHPQHNYHEADS